MNVPLEIDKCTARGTCTLGWEPLLYRITEISRHLSLQLLMNGDFTRMQKKQFAVNTILL